VLLVSDGTNESARVLDGDHLPRDLPKDARISLRLDVVKPVTQPNLSGRFGGTTHAAKSSAKRRCLLDGSWQELPLYRVEEQTAGASAEGPAVLEEAFYTCRVEAGWRFEFNAAGDILLGRTTSSH
jgi:N-methylhydantoinase A/oxoprolinase/acetone carboxylase beta subunit